MPGDPVGALEQHVARLLRQIFERFREIDPVLAAPAPPASAACTRSRRRAQAAVEQRLAEGPR